MADQAAGKPPIFEKVRTSIVDGLQPHRVRQFKLSTDPKFIDKLRDVVGLYVDPPARAIFGR
jgi:hypothetical protein